MAQQTPRNPESAQSEPSLFEVLDALRIAGIGFDLDHAIGHPVLVFEPELLPSARTMLGPNELLLTYVALGRYTGHAPASCSACGMFSMLSIRNSSGTKRGRTSTGWPACLDSRCKGRRMIRPTDDDTWSARAEAAMEQLIEGGEDFTSDDLLALVGPPDRRAAPNGPNSAVGAVFGRYSKAKRIVTVGIDRSKATKRKSGMVRVWRAAPRPGS